MQNQFVKHEDNVWREPSVEDGFRELTLYDQFVEFSRFSVGEQIIREKKGKKTLKGIVSHSSIHERDGMLYYSLCYNPIVSGRISKQSRCVYTNEEDWKGVYE